MCGEHGVTSAVDEAEHVVLHDLVAETNATRTENAAFIVQGDAWSELNRFRFLHFVFEESRTLRAVLDAKLLKLAFARLIADWTIERMIDEQKFHHAFATFVNQRRTCAHAHSFSDILGAANLRTRHPINDRFAIRAELGFSVWTHSRHPHLDQTH